MSVIIDILIAVSLIAVLASFFLGMVAFSKPATQAGEQSNTWMAWRVRTQVIAIVVLAISAWWKAAHG